MLQGRAGKAFIGLLLLFSLCGHGALNAQPTPQVSVMRGPGVSPLDFDKQDRDCRSLGHKAAAADQAALVYANCMKQYGNIVKVLGGATPAAAYAQTAPAAATVPAATAVSPGAAAANPAGLQSGAPAVAQAYAAFQPAPQNSGQQSTPGLPAGDRLAEILATAKRNAPGFRDDAYTPDHWTGNGHCDELYTIELQRTECVVDVGGQLLAIEHRLTPPSEAVIRELTSLLYREAALGIEHGAIELCTPQYASANLCDSAKALAASSQPVFQDEVSRRLDGPLTPAQRAERARKKAEADAAYAAATARQRALEEHRAEVAKDPSLVTLFNITLGKPVDYLLDYCDADGDFIKTATRLLSGMMGAKQEQCISAQPGPLGAMLGTTVLFSSQQKEDFPWLLASLEILNNGAARTKGSGEQSSIATFDVAVRIIDGRVERLSFGTLGKAHEDEILDALNEKFGHFVSRRMESFHNEYDATWENPIYTWRHGDVTATFEYDAFLTNPAGIVTVQSDRYKNQSKAAGADQKPKPKL